ncbi:DUF29 domain-containing protein [Phormidesmis sp. 146-12]
MSQPQFQISLYEEDFALWIEQTAASLKNEAFDQVDIPHMIDELSALGRTEKRELRSRLDCLLVHLLKRVFVDSSSKNSAWERTIADQRKRLKWLIEDSPSLICYIDEIFADAYQDALAEVQRTYRKTRFPDEWGCDRSVETLLSAQFWQD